MGSIAQTGFSRVFTLAGRARPDHAPAYQSLVRAGGVSQSFGDRENIEAPDPNRYGKFLVVGSVKGAKERAQTTLSGRYLADVKSELLRLAREGCPADIQIHFGSCTNPSVFNTFTKALVLENADIGQWQSDDLGALESGEQGKIDEQATVSADDVYEIVPLRFARAADTLLVSEVVDVVICGDPSCGDCQEENTSGTNHIYALATIRTASPGLPAEIIYTLDGGLAWNTSGIATMSVGTETPNGLACVGDYLIVIDGDLGDLHYVPLAELDTTGGETWLKLASEFAADHFPNDVVTGNTKAFIVTNGGYIYTVSNATDGAVLHAAGSALTTEDLYKVAAVDDDIVCAVGANNTVLLMTNGTTFATITGPAAGVDLTAVAIRDENIILVGTADGHLYYTLNGGTTWTEKTFTGSGAGKIWDIAYATNSVLYLAHATATPRGRILRSYDGGYSWSIMPETGTLPTNQRISCLTATEYDPNFVVAGGLDSTTGTDGLLLVGEG